MPISGPSSFVPTLNLFIPHWVDVNLALGAGGPLVLEDGTTIAILTGYRDELSNYRSSIQSKLNDVEIAGGFLTQRKTAMLARNGEFNRRVRGAIGSSPYAAALSNVPAITAAEGPFLEPLDDVASLWAKINAATIPGFTGPLLLPDGYAIATFLTDLAALKAAYATDGTAEQELKLERKSRDAVQVKAQKALVDYRRAIAGSFAENHPLVLSLPAVSPEPGSTPEPVTASIVWDPLQLKAKITFSASTDQDLDHYEIRFCPGPNYSTETEVVTINGNILPGGPLEFFTDTGLTAPGNIASFRVYAILTTANEKGSNTLTLTRP